MHPEIIGRHHRMRMLRSVIDYILEHDGVWFATMAEIADDFRARAALRSAGTARANAQ
jgi:hypothetical protein